MEFISCLCRHLTASVTPVPPLRLSGRSASRRNDKLRGWRQSFTTSRNITVKVWPCAVSEFSRGGVSEQVDLSDLRPLIFCFVIKTFLRSELRPHPAIRHLTHSAAPWRLGGETPLSVPDKEQSERDHHSSPSLRKLWAQRAQTSRDQDPCNLTCVLLHQDRASVSCLLHSHWTVTRSLWVMCVAVCQLEVAASPSSVFTHFANCTSCFCDHIFFKVSSTLKTEGSGPSEVTSRWC